MCRLFESGNVYRIPDYRNDFKYVDWVNCSVLTISPVTGFLQYALLGLLDDQRFEPRIIYERTTARWITILKQKQEVVYQTTFYQRIRYGKWADSMLIESSQRIRKASTMASSEVVSERQQHIRPEAFSCF